MNPKFGAQRALSIVKRSKDLLDSPEDISGHTIERTCTTPKHKASHLRFLTWVAYLRKYSSTMDDLQQRTCPLIECEQPFVTEEAMLQHVYECPRLSKGIYRCSCCHREERISKFHTNGCHDTHPGKDKLFTVANSLRLAKKIFSPHGSKRRHVAESQPMRRDSCTQEHVQLQELSATSDAEISELNSAQFPNELDTVCYDKPHSYMQELQGYNLPAELRGSHGYSCNYVQDGPAELACHDFSKPLNQRQGPNRMSAESCENTDHISDGQCPRAWISPPPFNDGITKELRLRIPGIDRSATFIDGDDLHQSQHMARPITGPPTYYRNINITGIPRELSSPDSMQESPTLFLVSPAESSTSTGNMTGHSSGTASTLSPLTPFTPIYGRDMETGRSSQPFVDVDRKPDSGLMFPELEYFGLLPAPGTSSSMPELSHAYVSPVYSPPKTTLKETRTHNHFQSPRALLPGPDSSPQASVTTSSFATTPHYFELNYRCDCGYEPHGKEINKKSNLKRHRKKSCRRYSPYSGSEKPHQCTYRNCGRRFTRSDNLLVHRRNKGHFESFELEVASSSPESGFETMANLSSEDHNSADWDIYNEGYWR